MAVTHIKTPQSYVPVYNPVIAVFSASTQTEQGFQFITNLYSYTGSNSGILIKQDKRPPGPDGYGVVDFSRPLIDYVGSDMYPSLTGFCAASGSMVSFGYVVGEEYISTYSFNRNFSGVVNSIAYVAFSSITSTHTFTAGDSVYITMNPTGNSYTYYNGPHYVLSAINTNAFIIDVPYGANTASPQAGTAIYADRRRTQTINTTIPSVYLGFNAAIDQIDWLSYTGTTYSMDPATAGRSLFLSNMPQTNWQVREDSRMTVHFLNEYTDTPFAIFIEARGPYSADTLPFADIQSGVYNNGFVNLSFTGTAAVQKYLSAGTFFTYSVQSGAALGMARNGEGYILKSLGFDTYETNIPATISAGANLVGTVSFGDGYVQGTYAFSGNTFKGSYPDVWRLAQAGVGPWNLSANTQIVAITTGSTFPIIKDNTTSYRFYLVSDFTGTTRAITSKIYSVNLDKRCSYFNDDKIQLYFKDRKGSFNSFTFDLKNVESTSIQRTEFKRKIGSYNPVLGKWTYNSYDRGRTNLDVNAEKKYQAHCNWITTDENADYLEELFTSPDAYWIRNDGTTVPVIITSSNYENKKRMNDRLFNATIEFELAYANSINV